MNVGELFVSLGFDVDDSSLKDFNAKIVEGRNEILEMSAAATAAVYALDALFAGSAKNAMEIKNFKDQLGYSGEELQKWQTVIHETNPSVGLEEAYRGYYKLGELLRDIRQGKGNPGALEMLGVTYDSSMTPEKALDQMASHIEDIISQKGKGIGFVTDKLNAIGLGAGSVNAIRLYARNRALFDRMAAGGVESENTIEANSRYAKTIAQLDVEWKKFRDDATAKWSDDVIREVNKANDKFKEFLKNVQAIYDWFGTHPLLSKITEIGAIGVAGFWAIATFPVTSAFVALAIAINDVGKALRGLPSVTGDFIDTEGKGLSLLRKDPLQFLNNIDKSLDPLRRRAGLMTSDFVPAGPSTNQTNHVTMQITRPMTKQELGDHLRDWCDDAGCLINQGAKY